MKLKNWVPSKRRIMQLYFALLFNANLKGFITGNIFQGSTKNFCAPGINCYSCPGAVSACPLGSLQGAFSADHSTIFYVCGILLLYGVLFGRMICGWFCGFGLIQELLHKIPTPKLKKSPLTRILSYTKYGILGVFVFLIPILYALRDIPLPAFCKYICPAGTLEGGLALLSNAANESYFSMLGPLFTWKFLILVAVVVGSIFIFRLFCRFLCPLGALYGLFNRFSLFGIKVNQSKCVDCGKCITHCKVDIRRVGDQECVSCGECIDVCPTQAIQWKGAKILLRPNEGEPDKYAKARKITRLAGLICMAALLVGSVTHLWLQEDVRNLPIGGNADRGNQVGSLCYDYSLELLDKNGPTGQLLDPTATGQVTVINFWGTWCTPCVQELPYFEQIAQENPDVTVVAIHSAALKQSAPEYIGKHYDGSPLLFSWDGDGEIASGEYYTALGGRGAYPYTVVLNEEGIITQIFLSSVTYEELCQAIAAARG